MLSIFPTSEKRESKTCNLKDQVSELNQQCLTPSASSRNQATIGEILNLVRCRSEYNANSLFGQPPSKIADGIVCWDQTLILRVPGISSSASR